MTQGRAEEGGGRNGPQPLRFVDAHQHFWDLTGQLPPLVVRRAADSLSLWRLSALRRRYLPPDYLHDSRGYEVVGSVYVETEWNPADPVGETRYIAHLRDAYGLPTVSVAQAWLDREDCPRTLEMQAGYDFVRSVRHKPRANASPDDAAPGGMADARWRAGYACLAGLGLRFDLQTPWWHLHEAAALAKAHERTQIILNHTGLPAIAAPRGLRDGARP